MSTNSKNSLFALCELQKKVLSLVGKGLRCSAWMAFISISRDLEVWGPLSQKYQHCSDCAQINSTEHAMTGPAVLSFIHSFILNSFIHAMKPLLALLWCQILS